MSLLYVARPIDQTEFEDPLLIETSVHLPQHAFNAKFGLYRPERAFEVGKLPPEPYVRMINNTALLFSDALLAIWPLGARSWGVPAEVERALTLDKPVAIVASGPRTWSMVDGGIKIIPTNVQPENVDAAIREAVQYLRQKVDEKQ